MMSDIGTSICWLLAFSMIEGPMASAAADPYFPPGIFATEDLPSGRGDISGMLAEWFSGHLRAMDEPSLWATSRDDRDAAAYRFLWLPTWGRPVSVRIERLGDGATLTLVQLDGSGGYDPGEIAVDKDVPLTIKQWDHLNALVGRAGFWDMPSCIDRRGCDGEEMVVEGIEQGGYHVVERWTPEPGAYRELCRGMLDLSGLDYGQRAWPDPPPSRAWLWVVVGLLALGLAFWIVAEAPRWLNRSRKPRKHDNLEELI